jgi:hypothetical protein
MTTRDYLSELPPDLADMVRAFRAEMRGACEQEAARLREALEHFKREMEIETARVKRGNRDCGASAVDRNFQGCRAV